MSSTIFFNTTTSELVKKVICLAPLVFMTMSPTIAHADEFPECQRFNSTTENGVLDRRECAVTQKYKRDSAAHDAAERQRRDEATAQINAEREAALQEEGRKAAEVQTAIKAAAVAASAQRVREEAIQKQMRAEDEAEQRADAVEAKRQQRDREARKAMCGTDYLTPRIGMSIERAQQCVGKFRMTSQLHRADGTVTTYSSQTTYLHAMNGLVVAWGRH